MERNKNVVVNIPSDGLEEEVILAPDLPEEEYRENVKKYISEYLEDTVCGRMFFNICYKRSVVHSDTADTYLYNIKRGKDGVPILDESGKPTKEPSPEIDTAFLNKGYRAMLERNIDIIKMAVDETKKYGAQAWLAVRMNDHHCADDPGFNSSFAYERAKELGVNGSRTYIDYTKTPVQNYYRNYIKEICYNYDIDGIELDFLRSAPYMSEVNEENTELITQFVASIRKITDEASNKRNRKIGLAVRVYPKEHMNLEFGIDPALWVAKGYVDILTIEGWYIPTYYDFPVEGWRKSIEKQNKDGHKYTILCGTDCAVECDETPHIGKFMYISLEQFKGFASSAYSHGADGIYIFNHYITNKDNPRHTIPGHGYATFNWDVDDEGNITERKVLKEKINSADSLMSSQIGKRCYLKTCTEAVEEFYPVVITPEKSFAFEVNTCQKPIEGYWHIVVGTDDESIPKVTLNGSEALYMGKIKPPKGFEYQQTETRFAFVNHVGETAGCVMNFEADLNYLKNGVNTVEISSDKDEICVRWFEIQTEDVDLNNQH